MFWDLCSIIPCIYMYSIYVQYTSSSIHIEYVYIHTHIYIHVYVCIYSTYDYIYTYIYTYIYIYLYIVYLYIYIIYTRKESVFPHLSFEFQRPILAVQLLTHHSVAPSAWEGRFEWLEWLEWRVKRHFPQGNGRTDHECVATTLW